MIRDDCGLLWTLLYLVHVDADRNGTFWTFYRKGWLPLGAGVRLVLDVETLSAGSIDEEEKGPEPVGVCRVSDSNWLNQRKRVWVDDCSTFTPASWHFHRRRPPDMAAQSRPDHFFLNFSSEYFLVQAPTNQHPDREISRWSNLRSNYLGSVLYKKWRRRKAKGCVFLRFSLPASPNCLLRNIRGT